jgi:prophage antirepressor-like protein
MRNKVQEFLNDKFGEVRAINKDGVMWFVATDIAKILDLTNISKSLEKHKEGKDKTTLTISYSGNMTTNVLCVSEQGLYKLIFKSRKPFAEEFQDWICGTVIPTLRKDGMYVDGEEEVNMNDELKQTEFILKAMEMLNNKVARLQKENEEMKPKADGWDRFLDTNGTYNFTDVSKLISTKANDEGLDIKITSVKLTELLRSLGILSKAKSKNGYKNLPNKEYEDYFNVSAVDTQHGFNKSQTRVNAKGVSYIYDIVKREKVS